VSNITSAHRLPPANLVAREAPSYSWTRVCLAAAALVAFLYVLAFLMAGGLS